jgi:hypothetical protein
MTSQTYLNRQEELPIVANVCSKPCIPRHLTDDMMQPWCQNEAYVIPVLLPSTGILSTNLCISIIYLQLLKNIDIQL